MVVAVIEMNFIPSYIVMRYGLFIYIMFTTGFAEGGGGDIKGTTCGTGVLAVGDWG